MYMSLKSPVGPSSFQTLLSRVSEWAKATVARQFLETLEHSRGRPVGVALGSVTHRRDLPRHGFLSSGFVSCYHLEFGLCLQAMIAMNFVPAI